MSCKDVLYNTGSRANIVWPCAMLCAMLLQLCLTLCDPLACSLPGSSVHGISQARILEWVAISFSRRSSQPRGWIQVSCIGRQIHYHWATKEAHTEKIPSYKCKLRLRDFCDTEETKYWRKDNFISFCIYSVFHLHNSVKLNIFVNNTSQQ